jgi:DNA mismatch endonuclease, patch repair protein
MSKSKDTKPELLIQDQLSKWQIDFECHARDLPGTPDLVFRKEKLAVLIHGCFWHQHGDCAMSGDIGKLNSAWKSKFVKSSLYDLRIINRLNELNWNVLILWECEIYSDVYEQAEKIVRAQYLNSLGSESLMK